MMVDTRIYAYVGEGFIICPDHAMERGRACFDPAHDGHLWPIFSHMFDTWVYHDGIYCEDGEHYAVEPDHEPGHDVDCGMCVYEFHETSEHADGKHDAEADPDCLVCADLREDVTEG